jgi:hypothetical protein
MLGLDQPTVRPNQSLQHPRVAAHSQFMQAMRTGRHQGQGRPILPPMPWQNVGQMTDEDLKAVFAYLRQIPAVKNKVPDPIPPVK